MQKKEYAQIHYNPDDLDDVFAAREVRREQAEPVHPMPEEERFSENLADDVREMMSAESGSYTRAAETAGDTWPFRSGAGGYGFYNASPAQEPEQGQYGAGAASESKGADPDSTAAAADSAGTAPAGEDTARAQEPEQGQYGAGAASDSKDADPDSTAAAADSAGTVPAGEDTAPAQEPEQGQYGAGTASESKGADPDSTTAAADSAGTAPAGEDTAPAKEPEQGQYGAGAASDSKGADPDSTTAAADSAGTAPDGASAAEAQDGTQTVSDERLDEIAKEIRGINYALRRLEKKVETEILNGDNRDSAVKTMYKELNDYKAGLIEKAMKNVLYDFADLREMMLSQIKYLREKKQQETISLEEFESYADDIADILEKHDVTVYRGEPGVENIAVRQKIVRKIETEDESLVKTVAESLSYGYEYNEKILYPEKISIYVKKK